MVSQRHRLITDSAKVFIANIVTTVVGIARGIIVAGVLGPNNYGVWSIFNVIMSYAPYAHFGLLDGMTKQIPLLKGKGLFERVKILRDTAWLAMIAASLIIPILMLLGSFISQNKFSNEVVVGFRILACLIALCQLYTFLTAYIRIDDRFGLLSISVGAQAVLSLALMVVLFKILPNKLYAALLGLFFTYLIINAYIFLTTKYDFNLKFDFSAFKSMIFVGFPISLICIGGVLVLSVDRWIVATFLGRENLGFYGFAFAISNLLALLPTPIAFTLYTRMLHRYGQTNNPSSSERLVYLPSLIVSYFMSVACLVTVIIMPVFIRYGLTAYLKGVDAVIILVLGGYFISAVALFNNFLISVDKVRQVFIAQVAAILLNLIVNISMVKLGFGIKGVAFGTGFSYMVYATLVIFFSQLNFHSKIKDIFSKIIELYLPFFIILLLFWVFRSLYGNNYNIWVAGQQICIVAVFAVLFIIFLNKKVNFFELLKSFSAKSTY